MFKSVLFFSTLIFLFTFQTVQSQSVSVSPNTGRISEILELNISGVGVSFTQFSSTNCPSTILIEPENIKLVQPNDTIIGKSILNQTNDQNFDVQFSIPSTVNPGFYDLVVGSNQSCPISCFDCIYLYDCRIFNNANAGIDQNICNSDSTQIGGLSESGFSYAWSPSSWFNSLISNPYVKPEISTIYSLTRTHLSSGCISKDTVSIAVLNEPIASFGFSINEKTIFFIDSSSGAENYIWAFGDGGTDSAKSPMHTYATYGNFIVGLTVSNKCGNDKELKIIDIKPNNIEILQNMKDNSFAIYPIPASDKIFINFEYIDRLDEIVLINIHGKKITSQKAGLSIKKNINNIYEFPLNKIPAGSYIIKINTTDGMEWKKLVFVIR